MKQSRAFSYRIIFISFIIIFLTITQGNAQTSRNTDDDRSDKGEQRFALVIGNSEYPFIGLPEAVGNSAIIAEALLARDFDVMTITNATEKQMTGSLREFARRLEEKGGDGLFYFAGHAVQFENTNYLLPVDIDLRQEYEIESAAISLTQILNTMRYTKNRSNVIILDSGYKGPISSDLYPARQGLAALDAGQLPANTILALATAPDTTIFDPGLYSSQLATGLKQPDLALTRLLDDLVESISAATSEGQKPWMVSTLNEGLELTPFSSLSAVETRPQDETMATATGDTTTAKTAEAGSADVLIAEPSDLEQLFWDSVVANQNSDGYQLYLERFPNGYYSEQASQRMQEMLNPALAADKNPDTVAGTEPAGDDETVVATGSDVSSDTDETDSNIPIQAAELPPSPDLVTVKLATLEPDIAPDQNEENQNGQQLIEQAWQAFEKKALTTPADDNAVKWAEMAMQVSSQQAEARKVFDAVVDTYLNWGRSNVNRGRLSQASAYLDRARSLDRYASASQQSQMTALAGSIEKRRQQTAADRSQNSRRENRSGSVDSQDNTLGDWFSGSGTDSDFRSHGSR